MAAGITVATPRPAAANPAIVPGTLGNASARSHAGCGDETAGAGHSALTEPVDQPVTDQPTDEHGTDQRDVAERRDRGRGAQAVAQIQCGPRTSGVLDGRPGDRDDHQRDQGRLHADAGASPARVRADGWSSWSGPRSRYG